MDNVLGKVFLVGAGPGDPGLLTVKALRILESADVVLHDRLVPQEIVALATRARRIDVGKRRGEQEQIQNRIFELLVHYANENLKVVRLKNGDPMVFSRGAEEWEYLVSRGIPVEVVPAVSSAIAVPSLAGIPPTCRGVAASFAVIAGHRQNLIGTDWSQYTHIDTLIILMGIDNREYIAESLIRAGRDPDQPVAFIERGSTPSERVVESNLSAVAAGTVAVETPAVFVIGEVVRLRARLARIQQEVLHAG